MLLICNHLYDLRKYFEVFLFRCAQLMFAEKRNYLLLQISDRTHTVAVQILGMIVVAFVDENLSAFEIFLEQF